MNIVTVSGVIYICIWKCSMHYRGTKQRPKRNCFLIHFCDGKRIVSTAGPTGSRPRGRAYLVGNCVTGVQANISKPTQFIYLAFEIKALKMLMGRLPELVNVHLLLKFAFISFSLFGVCFFPNRLTFVGNVFTDVGFKIGVRNFKICYH